MYVAMHIRAQRGSCSKNEKGRGMYTCKGQEKRNGIYMPGRKLMSKGHLGLEEGRQAEGCVMAS